MRIGRHFCSALMVCATLAAAGATLVSALQLPAAERLVSQVGKNVFQSWNALPDFVCSERIISQRLDSKGKLKEQRIVDSEFTTVRVAQKAAGYSMKEQRELTAIDGKSVARNAKMPKLPFIIDGIATTGLFMIFGAADAHTYHVIDGQDPDASTMKLEFATLPDQKRITGNMGDGAGSALIDLAAMQVLHFERRSKETPVTLVADFEQVLIGNQSHWLPTSVKAELTNKSNMLIFAASYTNCRKFEASVTIAPLP